MRKFLQTIPITYQSVSKSVFDMIETTLGKQQHAVDLCLRKAPTSREGLQFKMSEGRHRMRILDETRSRRNPGEHCTYTLVDFLVLIAINCV